VKSALTAFFENGTILYVLDQAADARVKVIFNLVVGSKHTEKRIRYCPYNKSGS